MLYLHYLIIKKDRIQNYFINTFFYNYIRERKKYDKKLLLNKDLTNNINLQVNNEVEDKQINYKVNIKDL